MTTVRRAGTVSAATLSGLALALALTHLTAPGWTRQVGLDVWNLNAAVSHVRTVSAESVGLRTYEEQLRQELELADQLTARLTTGAMSLGEATDVMEPIMRTRAGFETAVRTFYQAPTIRRGVARYLIHRVGRQPLDGSVLRAVVLARLEAEYAAME
jgi:hypothetical protein